MKVIRALDLDLYRPQGSSIIDGGDNASEKISLSLVMPDPISVIFTNWWRGRIHWISGVSKTKIPLQLPSILNFSPRTGRSSLNGEPSKIRSSHLRTSLKPLKDRLFSQSSSSSWATKRPQCLLKKILSNS